MTHHFLLALSLIAMSTSAVAFASTTESAIDHLRSRVCSQVATARFECFKLDESAILLFFDKKSLRAFYFGPISRGGAQGMKHLITQKRPRSALLTSYGGDVQSALEIAQLFNERGVQTIAGGSCASACALAWAASTDRALLPSTRLGFHQATWSHSIPRLIKGALGKSPPSHASLLVTAGFSRGLVARIEATPHSEILWLSEAELRTDGVQFSMADR